ncbi:hypothetical protein JXX16_15430, partial [Ruthenibacterium lactatiformans]|uniref:hypothetical protein n=2 Tax=Ruthenibacterium lactatiformans TaxID=1550024 RepID=UPI0019675B13
VATSFYQSSANHVSFYPLFNLRNLLDLIVLISSRIKKELRLCDWMRTAHCSATKAGNGKEVLRHSFPLPAF